MADPLYTITHSRVQAFFQCRKKYWFEYLSDLPKPEDPMNAPGIIGKGVHHAMKVLCDTGEQADAAHELDVYLRMPDHEQVGPGTPGHGLAFSILARGFEAHDAIDSEDRWAELDTWVAWPARGISVRALIDRVDRMDALHWQVIDWKTGLSGRDDVTDAQLDLGHLAARVCKKLPREATVTAIAWNLRSDTRRVRKLTREDGRATMRKYASLARRIQETADFSASPGPHCAYCRWRPQCPDAEQSEGADWDEELDEEEV
ncbi:MAG: PD-(D/E)XK nuclease family protein [Dehalococcoidia bacterium]